MSAIEVTPMPKDQGECGGRRDVCALGACPLYGTLLKPSRDGQRRVRGCGDPVARGKRNRAKGDRKAAQARRALGLVGPNTRHEELWRGGLLVESKAGAQAGPIWTRYLAARVQAEASRAVGDLRPFVMIATADRGRALLVIELADVQDVATAVIEQMGSAS